MKTKNSVNYDQIAGEYNQRFEVNNHKRSLEALRAILSQEHPQRVSEVGCGTGYWLKGLRTASPASFYGIDLSMGMLNQSERSDSILLSQAAAENLPFADEQYGLVYCVNALHHFNNPVAFIEQSFRVLQPGGVIAIIGMDPHDKRNHWYVYDYFEGVLARDLARFPDWQQVETWLQSTGFEECFREDIEFIHDPKSKDTVLEDPFLKKNACSQLALLEDDEYLRGFVSIQQAIHSPQDITFPDDILLSMQTARKPYL